MWKRPPTKRGRVEFADEGRGREASSLSVFVLGYAWQSATAKKAAGVAGYACGNVLACGAVTVFGTFGTAAPYTIGAAARLAHRAD